MIRTLVSVYAYAMLAAIVCVIAYGIIGALITIVRAILMIAGF